MNTRVEETKYFFFLAQAQRWTEDTNLWAGFYIHNVYDIVPFFYHPEVQSSEIKADENPKVESNQNKVQG